MTRVAAEARQVVLLAALEALLAECWAASWRVELTAVAARRLGVGVVVEAVVGLESHDVGG